MLETFMLKLRSFFPLIIIFILALIIRFLYFPDNIYFGFDQARDAFATKEIISGNFKVAGPPTTFSGLNHGVLYYYIYAPFYYLGGGDPAIVSGLLRVLNAAGVILIFILASALFNRSVGYIAALLFAFSFEQTQFSLYLNHPSLAVLSIMIMFMGLALTVFKREKRGVILAAFGLGLSIQFEFILNYLIVPFLAIIILFRKEIFFDRRNFFLAAITFFLTISTYIIAEFKFGFISFQSLPALLAGSEKSISNIFAGYLFGLNQIFRFNLSNSLQNNLLIVFFLIAFLKLFFSRENKKFIFLGIWFFSLFTIYIVNGGGDISSQVVQFHPNVGVSISLLIFISYLIYNLSLKSAFFATMIMGLIIFINLSMILKYNPAGSIAEINAQSGMILSDEKKVLDFIYTDSAGKPFAVKAITMPFFINTTWSYLFEWFGQKKYGYLPVWGGNNAAGYYGNLVVIDAQDKLPENRYLIIEPLRGIPAHMISDFLREEGYFSNLVQEKKIGSFIVQKRVKK